MIDVILPCLQCGTRCESQLHHLAECIIKGDHKEMSTSICAHSDSDADDSEDSEVT